MCELGLVPYADALAIQKLLRARRQSERLPDMLLLLEHPPVYTRGRRSRADELPLGEDFYRSRGIEVSATDRGGRVTYHGPGQLVGYPIMRIDDIGAYLRAMEAAIVSALAEEGVRARSRCSEGPDYTGVWVQERKIASIGLHVSRGVSTHGFAVNVNNELEPFRWVVACGLPGVSMTSLANELGSSRAVSLQRFRRVMAERFCHVLGREERLVSPARLGIEGRAARLPARAEATAA